MTRSGIEIVVGSEDIAWNDTGVHSAVLLGVAFVSNVDQSLGVTVPIVGRMRRTVVDLKQPDFTIKTVIIIINGNESLPISLIIVQICIIMCKQSE